MRGRNTLRKFNGKVYRLWDVRWKKVLAQQIANKFRKQGVSARIVLGRINKKRYYSVYVVNRRKR